MFWTRLASGIVLVILLGAGFYIGGPFMAVMFCLISVVGMYEFYRATGILEKDKKISGLTLPGYLGCLFTYAYEYAFKGDITYLALIPVFVCILMLAVFVLTFPKFESRQVVYAFFGYCYIALMLSFVYLTRTLPDGKLLIWLVIFATWVCDTFAYLTGMAFGKHKLAPVLSPKKSIEGSVGGVVFSALFAGVYGYIMKNYLDADYNAALAFAVCCALGAIVSQIGDLAASAFKRNFDVKDYGSLIPGHGGIMDRFDSMIFTAPMIYIVAVIFTGI